MVRPIRFTRIDAQRNVRRIRTAHGMSAIRTSWPILGGFDNNEETTSCFRHCRQHTLHGCIEFRKVGGSMRHSEIGLYLVRNRRNRATYDVTKLTTLSAEEFL